MANSYIEDLTRKLNRLPGIGQKTAQRLVFHILEMDEQRVKELADALVKTRSEIKECRICCDFTEDEICHICASKKRDRSIICVVETSKDVDAMEKSHSFNGLYHVLHGEISPLKGKLPEDVKLAELLKRLEKYKDEIQEVIIATNTTTDGEATANYLLEILKDREIKISRIGYGLPIGGDLQYYDELTLASALKNRRILD